MSIYYNRITLYCRPVAVAVVVVVVVVVAIRVLFALLVIVVLFFSAHNIFIREQFKKMRF